jgi:glycosyltransferase involved in cell wall biosynthesis
LLDDDCAPFTSAENVEQCAQAMLTVLNHPEATKARATTARQRVAGWSIEKMARAYEQVYEEVVAQHQVKRRGNGVLNLSYRFVCNAS